MVNCKHATELAQAGLDRPLSPWEKLKLGVHRLLCGPCRIYKRQIGQLRRLGAELRDAAAPPSTLSEAARERLRARLRGGGQA